MAAWVVAIISIAEAEPPPPWRIDAGLRGTSTLAVGDEPNAREGIVPSVTVRVARRLRSAPSTHLGVAVAAGAPAYYGRHELAVMVDRELVLGEVPRVSLSLGVDAGVGMTFADAPPELPATSDALLYWGGFVRALAALRIEWETPNGKLVGVAIGGGAGASEARYLTTATGRGLRVEPILDVALTLRL